MLDARVETEIYRFGPVPHEGRFAIVTDVRRDAMDADGAQRRSAPDADGEVVWSWRPDAGVKSAEGNFRKRRWQTSPVTGESTI